MKIIYAEKSTGIHEDASFQNPKYFERADKQAKSVVIYGDYPEIVMAYKDIGIDVEVRELSKQKGEITVGVQVGITPELQQVIDDAKSECEKVQTENTSLIESLNAALDAKDQLQAKLTETEGQLSAVQTENTELKAKIAEMEKASTAKKPTAAELKAAAKAAEEAKAAEQPQE